jgi:hypothetical protein
MLGAIKWGLNVLRRKEDVYKASIISVILSSCVIDGRQHNWQLLPLCSHKNTLGYSSKPFEES